MFQHTATTLTSFCSPLFRPPGLPALRRPPPPLPAASPRLASPHPRAVLPAQSVSIWDKSQTAHPTAPTLSHFFAILPRKGEKGRMTSCLPPGSALSPKNSLSLKPPCPGWFCKPRALVSPVPPLLLGSSLAAAIKGRKSPPDPGWLRPPSPPRPCCPLPCPPCSPCHHLTLLLLRVPPPLGGQPHTCHAAGAFNLGCRAGMRLA